jgi:hypothetical protein
MSANAHSDERPRTGRPALCGQVPRFVESEEAPHPAADPTGIAPAASADFPRDYTSILEITVPTPGRISIEMPPPLHGPPNAGIAT